MGVTYFNHRYHAIILSLALVALLALSFALGQLTVSQLTHTTIARLEERPLPVGCQYSVYLLALEPPAWMSEVWQIRVGREPDDFYARAYRNGYSAYMGVTLLMRGHQCL